MSIRVEDFRDPDLDLRVEDFHDPDWGTAKVSHYKGNEYYEDGQRKSRNRTEIVNRKTEMRYWYLPASGISIRASFISVGILAYTPANMACHFIRMATLIYSVAIRSLFNLVTKFSLQTIKNVVIDLTYTTPSALVKSVWSIVKAPFYAIAMEYCAIRTIFSPLNGRVDLGNIESRWRGIDRRNDMVVGGSLDFWRVLDFFTNPESPYGLHLAYCMQPWGSLRDDNIVIENGIPRCRFLKPNVNVNPVQVALQV